MYDNNNDNNESRLELKFARIGILESALGKNPSIVWII